MITTKHKHWDDQFRLWRQHSMSTPDTVRHSSKQVVFESYSSLGFNYRMTDIQAAVGREQLKRLPTVFVRRRELADAYRSLLAKVRGVTFPFEPQNARSNWQSYCVRLSGEISQQEVMQLLLDRGVSTRRGIMCAHREPAYEKEPWRSAGTLKHSEQAQDRCVLIPLYPQMESDEQQTVVSTLQEVLALEYVA